MRLQAQICYMLLPIDVLMLSLRDVTYIKNKKMTYVRSVLGK